MLISERERNMKVLQDFLNRLTGPALAEALVGEMLEHVEGFREDCNRCLLAVKKLREELGASADQVMEAIHQRFTVLILFSGYLGLRMNLDHFRNPMAPNCTWPQLDYNDYLREDLAQSLPEYRAVNQVLTNFCSSLTEEQKELYDTIMDYDSYLVTFGPKLAHYYGYLLGNTLLHWLVPGYHEDAALTYKYNLMLCKYFGKAFIPIAL